MAKRFNKYQTDSLKFVFEEFEFLTKQKKMDLVRVTGLDMEQIASWFNRKRARKRARESKRIHVELKQLLKGCLERKTKLQKELQESKRRQDELQDDNQHLKRRLSILEGDQSFDYLTKFILDYP